MNIKLDETGYPTEEGSIVIKQVFKEYWSKNVNSRRLPQHLAQLATDYMDEYYEAMEEWEREGR